MNGVYLTWDKGEDIQLTEHFRSSEFSCQCSYPDCVEQTISAELMRRLEEVRNEVCRPISVTSGYLCRKHQADLYAGGTVKTVEKSEHEIGHA